MANPTNIYVDPSIAADSGAGTVGDPYGDLQYALNQVTRDSTNGDQFNVKAGTAELETTTLSFVTYGSPTDAAPVIIRGYTSAADDGGIGEIDMQGNNASISTTVRVYFVHMNLHSTGSADIITGSAGVIDCELHGTTGKIFNSAGGVLIGTHVYDFSGSQSINAKRTHYNYIDNTQTTTTTGVIIDSGATSSSIIGNIIISNSSAAVGISIDDDSILVTGNSILSSAGTGTGIRLGVNRTGHIITNNIIEGFNGTGGAGFDGVSRSEGSTVFAGNAAYNNTTDYANPADEVFAEDNETLSATPFAKSGANTFANRLVYFSAADTGNVHGGAYGQN